MRRDKEKSVTPMYKVGSRELFASMATLSSKEKENTTNATDFRG